MWNEKNVVGMIRMACNLSSWSILIHYYFNATWNVNSSSLFVHNIKIVTILRVYVEANINFVALSFSVLLLTEYWVRRIWSKYDTKVTLYSITANLFTSNLYIIGLNDMHLTSERKKNTGNLYIIGTFIGTFI